MTTNEEQQFLNDLDKKLWVSADKLRSTLDASQYKHTVLGLIFLKYVSDSFGIRRDELLAQFKNPEHDYFLDPTDFPGYDPDGTESDEYRLEIDTELEERDYYAESLAKIETVGQHKTLYASQKDKAVWLSDSDFVNL